MPGFMSSNTAMIICQAEKAQHLDVDRLRQGAFTDVIDPNGRRFGWVGLGQLLDSENFFLALCDSRYAGFSFRMDTRKPSAAVIRLQLAKKIKEEEDAGARVGGKRKKELKEAIIAKLTAQAEFVPAMLDCIWDSEKARLFIAAAGEKAVAPVLEHFKGTFGMDAVPVAPNKDMAAVFSAIQRDDGIRIDGFSLQPMGSASLASGADKEVRSAIAVQNSAEAVSQALGDGLAIKKISLVAEKQDDDNQIYFSLDESLAVSGLRLPKAEKGADEEATFLINADICATVADMVEKLAL